MDNAIKPNEPEATASMPMLPEPALPGGFALVIDHFISEITDCTQQQKTSPPSLSISTGFPWLPFSVTFTKYVSICASAVSQIISQKPVKQTIGKRCHHIKHDAKTDYFSNDRPYHIGQPA